MAIAQNHRGVRPDAERRYTGTNFVVATLIVLLTLVGIYYVISQANDFADDDLNQSTQAAVSESAR